MDTEAIIQGLNSGSLDLSDRSILETGEQPYYKGSVLTYAILVNGDRIHKTAYNPSWLSMGNNAAYLAELDLMNELIDKGEV